MSPPLKQGVFVSRNMKQNLFIYSSCSGGKEMEYGILYKVQAQKVSGSLMIWFELGCSFWGVLAHGSCASSPTLKRNSSSFLLFSEHHTKSRWSVWIPELSMSRVKGPFFRLASHSNSYASSLTFSKGITYIYYMEYIIGNADFVLSRSCSEN